MSESLRDLLRKQLDEALELMQKGKLTEALDRIINAEKVSQDVGANDIFLYAQTLMGRLMQTEGAYEEALRIYSLTIKAILNLKTIEELLSKGPDNEIYLLSFKMNLDAVFTLGALFYNIGRFQQVKSCYELSLSIFQKLLKSDPGNVEYQLDIAMTLNNLGILFRNMGRFEEAKQKYEQALKMREKLLQIDFKNPIYQSIVGDTLNDLGIVLYNMGSFEEAKQRYEQAFETREELLQIDPKNLSYQSDVAMTLNNLSLLLSDTGRFEEAKQIYGQALEIYEELLQTNSKNRTYQLNVGTTLHNLGFLLSNMGRFEEAKQKYELALEMRKELLQIDPKNLSYQSDVAMTLHNLGILFGNIGRFEEAKQKCELALEMREQLLQIDSKNLSYQSDVAKTLNSLGILFRDIGRFKEAKQRYEQAFEMREELLQIGPQNLSYQSDVAMTLNNLGILFRDIGRFEEAKQKYEQALEIYKELLQTDPTSVVYHSYVGETLNNLGNLLSDMGRFEEAKQKYEQALEIYEKLLQTDPTNVSYQTGVGGTLNNLGTLLLRQENYLDALNFNFRALNDFALNSGNLDLLFKVYESIGRCYEKLSDYNEAFSNYKRAIECIESIRSQYSIEEFKIDIMWDKNVTYIDMISLLCTKMNDVGRALEYVEKSKSRTLLDLLRFVELKIPEKISEENKLNELELFKQIRKLDQQKRTAKKPDELASISQQIIKVESELNKFYNKIADFAPEYVDLRKGKPLEIHGMIKLLETQNKETAFVEYYTAKDKMFIFVVSSKDKKPKVKVVNISSAKLLDYVERYFTEIVEMPGIGDTWEELSDYLIAPVFDDIKSCDLVYIIPYGLLHYLPFHALPIKNKRLIEYFPIVYTPSLTAIKYSQGEVALSIESCLSLGYTPNKDEKELFEGEATLVADIFNVEPYLDKNATISCLFQDNIYDVIHISCHGDFNYEDPLESGLILADKTLTTREIFGMDIKSNILVLSACLTGMNEHKPGDELIGLTRAFLYAGAKSIIVSLWSVNVESTLEFMKRFYQKIKNEEMTKAEALQKVQIEFIGSKNYSHPYFWAPFILIGDWK